MIPFRYGTVVKGDFFCGREVLLERCDELFTSSQNVVLYGERRMGKTSLIVETLRRRGTMKGVFVDFMGVKSEDDAYKRIVRSLLSHNTKKSVFDILMKGLATLRPQLTIDPMTQLPSLTIDSRIKLEDSSIDAVFQIISDINDKALTLIVFDEFQDLLKLGDSYDILSKLRGRIQHLPDVPFVFAGSIRKKMESIFSDPNSPFFKSAIPIMVDKLERKAFEKFLVSRFKKGKRTLKGGLLDTVFQVSEMVTGDVQQLCEALWSTSSYGDDLTDKSLDSALKLIFSHEKISYEYIYSELTEFQSRVLLALASHSGKEVYSNSFLGDGGFTNSSSVKKALDRLMRSEIIFHSQKEYKFINPFFKIWLIKNLA